MWKQRFLFSQAFLLWEALHLDFVNQDQTQCSIDSRYGMRSASASVSAMGSIFAMGSLSYLDQVIQDQTQCSSVALWEAKVLRDANQLVEAKQLGEAHMLPQAISLLILLRSSYSIFASDRDLTQNLNPVGLPKHLVYRRQSTKLLGFRLIKNLDYVLLVQSIPWCFCLWQSFLVNFTIVQSKFRLSVHIWICYNEDLSDSDINISDYSKSSLAIVVPSYPKLFQAIASHSFTFNAHQLLIQQSHEQACFIHIQTFKIHHALKQSFCLSFKHMVLISRFNHIHHNIFDIIYIYI